MAKCFGFWHHREVLEGYPSLDAALVPLRHLDMEERRLLSALRYGALVHRPGSRTSPMCNGRGRKSTAILRLRSATWPEAMKLVCCRSGGRKGLRMARQ